MYSDNGTTWNTSNLGVLLTNCWDDNNFYIRVSNVWKKIPLTTF
jgi:hypothetical protein